MPSLNPALHIVGPCLVQTRGQTLYSKANVVLTPKLETFNIETSRHGVIEEREQDLSYELSFTPVGSLDALAVLWPYGGATPGELIHATTTLTGIDTATDILTATSLARFREACPVRFAFTGNAPAGIDPAVLYFLHKLSATTGTLHPTEADALAATAPVDIIEVFPGRLRLIEEDYTIIHTCEGEKYTFHNTAVVQSPAMALSTIATVIGEVRIECFRRFGVAPGDAASFFTKTTTGVTDATFDPAAIVTEAATLSWGAAAPWASLSTQRGISAEFPLTLEPVGDDASGTTTRRITALACTVKAQPLGISSDDLHAALVPQGAGAGRGRRLDSSKVLNASTPSIYLRVYGAMLKPGQINHDTREQRIGELTWMAARVFPGGVAQPLYYVGAAAPV